MEPGIDLLGQLLDQYETSPESLFFNSLVSRASLSPQSILPEKSRS